MNTRRRKDAVGVALLGISILLLLGIAVAQGVRAIRVPSVDLATGCTDRLSSETLLLIDTTDPLTERQRHDLGVRVHGLARELGERDRLTVYLVGDFEEGSLRRVLCRCASKGQGNPLVENPRLITAVRDSHFTRPLDLALEEVAQAIGATHSPLLASLQSAALDLQSSPAQSRRLVFVSDLVERSRDLRFDETIPEFGDVKTNPAARDQLATLGASSVDVWQLTRKRDFTINEERLRSFWLAYFRACGAESVRMVRL